MNISDVIINLDLKIGEQHRGDCPACAGHNTFTVTRTIEGTLFNCYKAGCRLAGRKATSIRVSDLQVSDNQEDTSPFSLPPHVVIGRSEITEWINKHAYPFENVELYYDLLENRIVFPVRHEGVIVDATGRATDQRQPKWKRYGSSGYAYTSGEGAIAIVVEDVISAAVAGATDDKCTGMAILGTSLLPSHVEQLQDYTGVIVALDPDAVKKTLIFAQELRGKLQHQQIYAARLEDDLKYRRKHDIRLMKEKIEQFNAKN